MGGWLGAAFDCTVGIIQIKCGLSNYFLPLLTERAAWLLNLRFSRQITFVFTDEEERNSHVQRYFIGRQTSRRISQIDESTIKFWPGDSENGPKNVGFRMPVFSRVGIFGWKLRSPVKKSQF